MIEDVTCPKCGAVYEMTEHKFAMRDKDSYECSCGHELRSWDGSVVPSFSLKKAGREPDAQGS